MKICRSRKVMFCAIIVVFLNSCWMDSGNSDDGIKIINSSNRDILIYVDRDASSVFDKDDSGRIAAIVKDSFSSGYGTMMRPHSIAYASIQDYRYKNYWNCCVKNGELLLIFLDKKKHLETKNIDSSKLKFIYLTYDKLMRDSCTVRYDE